jgi:hypothetical protein
LKSLMLCCSDERAAATTAASPWKIEMIVQAGKKVIAFPDHLSAEEVEREMRLLTWNERADAALAAVRELMGEYNGLTEESENK